MSPIDLRITRTFDRGDYILAKVPGHPNAMYGSYVYLHRFIVERKIGRFLLEGEVVHHKNGNKRDNRLWNLERLIASTHASLHHPSRRKKVQCCYCGKKFERRLGQLPQNRGTKNIFCSTKCKKAPKSKHGTEARYQWGCKCPPCKHAHCLYTGEWKRRRRAGLV